ncbi:hypothetical protein F383_18049 [Gossypium arboreum]|uniref:Uncharacterized protein n=1 Tax=Gossypium arboreum TaxID=29729 RepID=A0A0B0NM86_GOSAR|nr:hypothetical protein F383_18049 [Gossypium arboreum]
MASALRFLEYPLVFQMVRWAAQGFVKEMTSIAKLARESKDVEGSFTLSIGSFGYS